MVLSCAVGKIEANLWLLWEGTRLPFTAWHWSAKVQVRQIISALLKASEKPR